MTDRAKIDPTRRWVRDAHAALPWTAEDEHAARMVHEPYPGRCPCTNPNACPHT